MSEKIKVEAIRICIGRKVLELTPEELRELRDIVDETFPKQAEGVPIIIDRPVYERPRRYWDRPVWCEETADGATFTLNCRKD